MAGLSDEAQLAELSKRYRLVEREIRNLPIHKVVDDLKKHGFLIQRINYVHSDSDTVMHAMADKTTANNTTSEVIDNLSVCIFAPVSPLGNFDRILPLLERRFETWYVGNKREDARRIFFHYGIKDSFRDAPLTNSIDRDGSMITIRACTNLSDAYRITQHLCSLLGWSWVATLGYCRPPTRIFYTYWTRCVIQNPLLRQTVSNWLATTPEGAKTLVVLQQYLQIPQISIPRVVEVSSFFDGIHNLGAFFQDNNVANDTQLAQLENEIDYLVLLTRSMIPYIVSELHVLVSLQATLDDVENERYGGEEIPNPTRLWVDRCSPEERTICFPSSLRDDNYDQTCGNMVTVQMTDFDILSQTPAHTMQDVIALTDDATLLTDTELLAKI